MTLQIKKFLFTVDDYYRMAEVGILPPDERVELINGEIIKMSPIKSFYARIVDILAEISISKLHTKAITRIQNPIAVNRFSESEPGIAIVKKIPDRYYATHPSPSQIYLIIEVSDSTLEKDSTLKKELYAKSNIPEYWIVNIPKQQIEIYSQPKGDDYSEKLIVKKRAIATCQSIAFEVSVDEIFPS